MRKELILLSMIIGCVSLLCVNCGNSTSSNIKKDKSETTIDNKAVPQPLNISVYLDLSDRLMRDLTPSQKDRDIEIITHLIDIFIADCINNGKIINSKNHFQIFFYPSPNNSEIATLARGLNIDLAKIDMKEKKAKLMDMKSQFQTNLTQIYNDAINEKKWIGSDIWGFFSNKEVDNLCIRKGYRNILIILTDGYLYYEANKIKDGTAYSYVLPQTLNIEGSSLIAKRDGLTDLEILMLEVNPYNPKQHDALISVLENWFKDMGIRHFVVSETSLPVNTEVYIDNFINE